MKKMMVIMAAVVCASFAQAAAVSWNTGAIKSPNPDGSFGPNVGATTGQYLATIYLFADAGGTAGEAITLTGGFTDNSTGVTSTLSGQTTGYDFLAGGTYWARVIVNSLPAEGTYYTMTSDIVSFTIPGTGNPLLNFTTAGAMPSQWTVVPEPTSMALLALGVSAIGLRRRFRK